MIRLNLVFFILYCSCSVFGQDSSKDKWLLSVNLALQANDKRLFDFPGKDNLLDKEHAIFGTYQLSLNVLREIFRENKSKCMELSTFKRPFDSHYNNIIGPDLLTYTDKYYQYLVQTPIIYNQKFNSRFMFSMELLPQFNFKTNALFSKTENYNYAHAWNGFNFYSIEFCPGLIYHTNVIDFGMYYRVFQIKKIDKIIFNDIIEDPRINQNIENHNPFKLQFGFYYKM